jgi:glutamyl-tRNA reductase
MMNILLLGLNHKTAPVEVRERLDFSPAMLRSALTHFDVTHSQAHLKDVREGVILSTCNRMEVYTLVHDPQVARKSIIKFLSRVIDVDAKIFAQYLYINHDETAVRHLMRVAGGLDSMVLGEPQILGQITAAYEAASAQQAAGTVLSALFRAAIHAGKRARTETAISVNPSSISSVAAGLATELLGDLSERQVLLIGAGEMGAIAARSLLNRGVTGITVANRTYKNAVQLAKAWDGKAITFQQLPEAMAQVDIIITSTGAPHTILERKQLEPIMAGRPERPLFIIDIAVPRDVDPNVLELPNVHLHDIDDLQSQAKENVLERQSEIPRVEAIIDEEAVRYLDWLASLDVVSTITDLRQQVTHLRQLELDRLFNRLDLDERQQELVATMSHRLINKILHEPTLRLKKEAANGHGPAFTATLRYLFALDDDEPPFLS